MGSGQLSKSSVDEETETEEKVRRLEASFFGKSSLQLHCTAVHQHRRSDVRHGRQRWGPSVILAGQCAPCRRRPACLQQRGKVRTLGTLHCSCPGNLFESLLRSSQHPANKGSSPSSESGLVAGGAPFLDTNSRSTLLFASTSIYTSIRSNHTYFMRYTFFPSFG